MSIKFNEQFRDKVFVVTGGNQGLGAAVSLLLAERGARGLVICGRNQQAGAAQVDKLRAAGCEAWFVAADFSDPASCERVIAEAESRFGTLHGWLTARGCPTAAPCSTPRRSFLTPSSPLTSARRSF